MKKLSTSILLNMFYQLLVLLVPFVTAPYLSRVLEPDGIGIVSYTMSVQSYFIMFAILGTTGYGTRKNLRKTIDSTKKAVYILYRWKSIDYRRLEIGAV